jgi:hypothetical protein
MAQAASGPIGRNPLGSTRSVQRRKGHHDLPQRLGSSVRHHCLHSLLERKDLADLDCQQAVRCSFGDVCHADINALEIEREVKLHVVTAEIFRTSRREHDRNHFPARSEGLARIRDPILEQCAIEDDIDVAGYSDASRRTTFSAPSLSKRCACHDDRRRCGRIVTFSRHRAGSNATAFEDQRGAVTLPREPRSGRGASCQPPPSAMNRAI